MSLIARMQAGANRIHVAELVLDLEDLCELVDRHVPITFDVLARVRGTSIKTARRKLRALRPWLRLQGLAFTLSRSLFGEETQISFDVRAVRAFVERELSAAERVLSRSKRPVDSGSRRFRGT